MIDGGAPYISQAQAAYEDAARQWQQEAAAKAAHYTAMAQGLKAAYDYAIKESFKNAT